MRSFASSEGSDEPARLQKIVSTLTPHIHGMNKDEDACIHRVIAPLGGCIFENSIDLEMYLLQACRTFKDHMYLVTRNLAFLHANNKGTD